MNFAIKNAFWLVAALYVALIVFSSNLPVFWDMYGQVKTAHYFSVTGFHDLFPNGNAYSDNGHFPLYSIYLALLFKIFGFKLWIAHFSVLPFVLGLLWQLKKIADRSLSAEKTLLVLLLTLAHPAIITQAVYFSSEISIVFFSLWMINALHEERASHISMSSILLCLFNLRGISLVILLFLYFGISKKQKNAYYLLTGIACWLLWMFVHYYITGWFLKNPENMEHRSGATTLLMLKNFLICIWKLLDLGSVIGWIIILISVIRNKRSNEVLNLLLLSAAAIFLICIPLSNPVSNRYFLLSYVLLLPALVFAVSELKKKLFISVVFIFALVLLRNNWISYPNKYGNAWDCTLKSVTYFDVRKELDEYVAGNKISPKDVSAGFQVYFNDIYYLMNDTEKEYALLSDIKMPQTLYVADSDICNNYNAAREKYLMENYNPEKSFTKGSVYINLYKRKN